MPLRRRPDVSIRFVCSSCEDWFNASTFVMSIAREEAARAGWWLEDARYNRRHFCPYHRAQNDARNALLKP